MRPCLQFIKPDYPAPERTVHVELRFRNGRVRDSVSPTADFEIADRFLSDDLPHLC